MVKNVVTNAWRFDQFFGHTGFMLPFIRKVKTNSGATAVQIIHKQGRRVERIDHIGSAHGDTELKALIACAKEKIHEGQLALAILEDDEADIYLEHAYSKLLWDSLAFVYTRLGFGMLGDDTFRQLVLARIIEPTSKLDTIRVLDELGLAVPSNTSVHRCLRKVITEDYRSTISTACFRSTTPKALSLVLYDVTTLYFEIQKEDGYRKPGMSKERRLEPQITVGLLVDRDGFPLEVASFEGNRAEVKTIIPVLEAFRARHKISDITVTADAAMLSSENVSALEDLGYNYIVGSRLTKFPYEIERYLRLPGAELVDGQIFESRARVTVAGKRTYRRCIYQYRAKRAALDLSNIDKTLAKAQRMVAGTAEIKRNRFLKLTGATKEINEELVASARMRAGFKGYVTNLKAPAAEIIGSYHQLFQVERSFRMSKSDLKARPIFHHLRDSIEAHLTVVFAALAICRYIEAKTHITIKRFVRKLAPVRTGVISINGAKQTIKARVPEDVTELLLLLD